MQRKSGEISAKPVPIAKIVKLIFYIVSHLVWNTHLYKISGEYTSIQAK